ncbi:Hypothetical predicted protein [Lynx pardinus]|uniref:Uncharacterized protein n=1 Tax=Lynx pardinus TaxID=191816 RepID=A0A485NRS0_LYNPA|nr:Hypothetical predicted protein [Lynx pardinus]
MPVLKGLSIYFCLYQQEKFILNAYHWAKHQAEASYSKMWLGVFSYQGSVFLEKYLQWLRSEYMMIMSIIRGIQVDNPFASTREVRLCDAMGLPGAPNDKLNSCQVVGHRKGE